MSTNQTNQSSTNQTNQSTNQSSTNQTNRSTNQNTKRKVQDIKTKPNKKQKIETKNEEVFYYNLIYFNSSEEQYSQEELQEEIRHEINQKLKNTNFTLKNLFKNCYKITVNRTLTEQEKKILYREYQNGDVGDCYISNTLYNVCVSQDFLIFQPVNDPITPVYYLPSLKQLEYKAKKSNEEKYTKQYNQTKKALEFTCNYLSCTDNKKDLNQFWKDYNCDFWDCLQENIQHEYWEAGTMFPFTDNITNTTAFYQFCDA